MGNPGVIFQRCLNFAMTKIIEIRVHYDTVAKHDINQRVVQEKNFHGLKAAGEILLVAVEVSQNFSVSPAQAAIDRVIHSAIAFDKQLDSIVLPQPIERAIR